MEAVNPLSGFVTIGDRTISLPQWSKEFLDSDESPVIHKTFTCTIEKGASDDDRTIKTIISDGKSDIEHDVLNSDGWLLEDYAKNPVVLWAHQHDAPPIAKSVVKAFKSKLTSSDTFATAEQYPFAETIFQLVKGGFINAKSVGFYPTEYTWDEKREGFNFEEQTLLEHSYVPIPANPRALIVARSKGIDLAPLVGWAEKVLDEWREEDGVYVPRSTVEAARKESGDFPIYFLHYNDGTEVVTSTTYTDDPKETDIVENEPVDTLKTALEGLSEESQDLLRKRISLKSVETELEDKGFSEDEIADILKDVRALEGETVVEKGEQKVAPEEKSGEEVFNINEDDLRAAIADNVGEVKDALTELTGKVN